MSRLLSIRSSGEKPPSRFHNMLHHAPHNRYATEGEKPSGRDDALGHVLRHVHRNHDHHHRQVTHEGFPEPFPHSAKALYPVEKSLPQGMLVILPAPLGRNGAKRAPYHFRGRNRRGTAAMLSCTGTCNSPNSATTSWSSPPTRRTGHVCDKTSTSKPDLHSPPRRRSCRPGEPGGLF